MASVIIGLMIITSAEASREMVELEKLENAEEIAEVKAMIQRHADYTNSDLGWRVLLRWDELLPKIVKVMPRDYKRMLEALQQVQKQGLSGEEAIMAAFEINKNDVSRVGGN